jgi:CubicO group peptidase (beta-lactamase class C family)
MKKALLLAATTFCVAAWSQPNLQNRFDSLTAAYEQNGYHGVILVAKGDQILYEKGYGYAHFDQKIKHTPATEFKTESVGKMFTATAILQLVEQNKLSLSQTVKELIPELKIANADKITVDHLLKHTSGLQSPWDHPEWRFKKDHSKAELMKIVEEVPLSFDTPGKEMHYSNSGYFVLGWIIEKVSGKPFDRYFQEAFFSKLGMTQTRHLNDTLMPVKTGAQPYRIISSKKFIPMTETVGPKASAAGEWLSTASDLYRFMLALNTGKLLKTETWETMKTANHSNPKDSVYRFYAYGLETYIHQLISGSKLYGHNGGGAGFSIDAFVDPVSGYIVASCTNLYQNSRPIAVNYLKLAMDKPLQPVSRSFAVAVYDLIDSVGIDNFIQNEKNYFRQLGLNLHPGMFAQMSDAMAQAGDHLLCTKWMELARTYFPEEGYLWVLSGDNQLSAGNKAEARKLFERAKEVGSKRNDGRVVQMADEKLKRLL